MMRRYRVGCLFTVCGTPIEDATVTVDAGRIVAVEETVVWPDAVDLRHWAIMPALVNAHCHLEFSKLAAPLGHEGMAFPAWVSEVIRYRQGLGENVANEKAEAIRQGLRESARYGVAAVGDIATLPLLDAAYANEQVHVVALLECLGLEPARAAEHATLAADHATYRWPHSRTTSGLSPHAPYSTRRETVDRCVELSQKHAVPVVMHLAESLDELQLIEEGQGPFREVLQRMGLFQEADFPGGRRVLDYLKQLAPAWRAMVVHGNYLGEDESAFLAEHTDTMTVCYCPRTHAYFRHDRHPVEALLADRIRVVLGTDSKASNPDLDLWAEVRHLHREFPNIPLEQVLPMVTRDAAFALGLEGEYGTIEPGKRAVVAAFAIGTDCPDPYLAIVGGTPRLWDLGEGLTQLDLATA